MSDKSKYSSQIQPLDGPPGNPVVFPLIMLGTASFLGAGLYFAGVEGRLSGVFPSAAKAKNVFTVMGAVSITAGHGYAMIFNGNARRVFNVPHPKSSDDVSYLNATRGYYNFVEHMPFFLFNYILARESSPCIAGLASVFYGIGRILYTKAYALEGPKARAPGFMMATMSSMACLGIVIFDNLLN